MCSRIWFFSFLTVSFLVQYSVTIRIRRLRALGQKIKDLVANREDISDYVSAVLYSEHVTGQETSVCAAQINFPEYTVNFNTFKEYLNQNQKLDEHIVYGCLYIHRGLFEMMRILFRFFNKIISMTEIPMRAMEHNMKNKEIEDKKIVKIFRECYNRFHSILYCPDAISLINNEDQVDRMFMYMKEIIHHRKSKVEKHAAIIFIRLMSEMTFYVVPELRKMLIDYFELVKDYDNIIGSIPDHTLKHYLEILIDYNYYDEIYFPIVEKEFVVKDCDKVVGIGRIPAKEIIKKEYNVFMNMLYHENFENDLEDADCPVLMFLLKEPIRRIFPPMLPRQIMPAYLSDTIFQVRNQIIKPQQFFNGKMGTMFNGILEENVKRYWGMLLKLLTIVSFSKNINNMDMNNNVRLLPIGTIINGRGLQPSDEMRAAMKEDGVSKMEILSLLTNVCDNCQNTQIINTHTNN
ncbi:hypothetical protein SNEBB_000003 [Seison nebaliae]|nr:hypothetical protein SNEBB_000003 [Seison nebaliae]